MTELRKENDKMIVKPAQDIVSSAAEEIKKELKQIIIDHQGPLVIDLDGVNMIDSMGLGVLIAAHNSLKRNNLQLELINTPEEIKKLLAAMRLDSHFIVA